MRLLAAFAALVATSLATAQTPDPSPEKPSGVQAVRSFEGSIGYARNFAGGDPSSIYYRLVYLGNPLFERGTMPKLAAAGSTFLTDPSEVDGYDLKFLLNDGVGKLSGPLGDLIALRPINVGGGFFQIFHGKVQTTAKLLDDQQYNLGVGLESVNVFPIVPLLKGLHVPAGLGIGDPAKVLRIGVLGEKQSRERASSDTKTTDTLQFTYRAYVALGFKYVIPVASHALREAVVKRIDGLTADDVADLRARFNSHDPAVKAEAARDPLVQSLVFLKEFNPTLFDLPLEGLKALLRNGVPVYTDQRAQPSFNLEARAEGSYNPLDYDVRRYNALYTVAVNVWLNPRRPDDGKLTLGYQNGYSRGALTQSLNGFIATLGFKL